MRERSACVQEVASETGMPQTQQSGFSASPSMPHSPGRPGSAPQQSPEGPLKAPPASTQDPVPAADGVESATDPAAWASHTASIGRKSLITAIVVAAVAMVAGIAILYFKTLSKSARNNHAGAGALQTAELGHLDHTSHRSGTAPGRARPTKDLYTAAHLPGAGAERQSSLQRPGTTSRFYSAVSSYAE